MNALESIKQKKEKLLNDGLVVVTAYDINKPRLTKENILGLFMNCLERIEGARVQKSKVPGKSDYMFDYVILYKYRVRKDKLASFMTYSKRYEWYFKYVFEFCDLTVNGIDITVNRLVRTKTVEAYKVKR